MGITSNLKITVIAGAAAGPVFRVHGRGTAAAQNSLDEARPGPTVIRPGPARV